VATGSGSYRQRRQLAAVATSSRGEGGQWQWTLMAMVIGNITVAIQQCRAAKFDGGLLNDGSGAGGLLDNVC
jgi:hypothetical protein